MKHAKRIGALICVIAICFTLTAAPSAHAIGALSGQAAGALVSAGLISLNIVAQVVAGNIGAYFGWQDKPSAQSILDYNFPVASQYISDYMNASTIKVDQGVTTIDGVVYDELWIEPGTFTNGLKTNLFDFKTKWNILSGNAGTLAKGWGIYNGIPVYQVGSQLRTQSYVFDYLGNFMMGDLPVEMYKFSTDNYSQRITWPNGSAYRYGSCNEGGTVNSYLFRDSVSSGVPTLRSTVRSGGTQTWSISYGGNFVNEPFQFDYVSGIVPADQSEIPDNYGLSIQIPHDQLHTFYNTYPQYNVDNSTINIQQDEIDIDQLVQAIFDQIQSMEDIKAEWNEGPVEPEPEPEPPEPVEDVIDGLNVIAQQQFEQMQQQTQIQQQQQQMQQQQLQEQQQISQNTSEINDTIKDVTATPDADQLPSFKFDLRELFPFCIPFDIYRLLSSFDAEPQAPHVQLPIVIESINFRYNLDLDFSAWDPVAQAMRTAELIVYAIGLAWATGKVIKW